MATRARIQPSRVMTPRAPARVSRVSGRCAPRVEISDRPRQTSLRRALEEEDASRAPRRATRRATRAILFVFPRFPRSNDAR
eukprot:31392-Pelagococcus_subviridis.AAC.11